VRITGIFLHYLQVVYIKPMEQERDKNPNSNYGAKKYCPKKFANLKKLIKDIAKTFAH